MRSNQLSYLGIANVIPFLRLQMYGKIFKDEILLRGKIKLISIFAVMG
jgi:hypothetical protein